MIEHVCHSICFIHLFIPRLGKSTYLQCSPYLFLVLLVKEVVHLTDKSNCNCHSRKFGFFIGYNTFTASEHLCTCTCRIPQDCKQ